MDYSKIIELNKLALNQVERYSKKRFIFESLKKKIQTQKRFLAVIGPRGTGKTILLRQLARETEASVYISLDALTETDLFETVKQLSQVYKYRIFFLDEIHFIKDFEKELKKIYDFLEIKIICTSSAALYLHESALDLSRRIELVKMHPFSYREFLYFKENILLEPITFNHILNNTYDSKYLRYGYLFNEYLKGGLYPFALEEMDILSVLKNIIQKILYRDIPALVSFRMNELEIMNKMIRFIGKSQVDGINYSAISRNLGITKFKAEQYLKLLEKTFILRIIFPKGSNVIKEPKVLMRVPYRLLYSDYDFALGGLREDYFTGALLSAGFTIHYLKSTRGTKTPDYIIDTGDTEIIAEVGGKGKGRQQFKGVNGKKQIIFYHNDMPQGIKKPLFLLGYL